MIRVLRNGLSVLVSFSLVCMFPMSALAEENQTIQAVEQSTNYSVQMTERDIAIQGVVANSMKAGAAVDDLSEATDGGISVDFNNLPDASNDAAWLADAQEFLDSVNATQPALLAADNQQSTDFEAQADAVSYSFQMAQWSISQGRASDLETESEYMFLSHYVDVGTNYWTAGNNEYLYDGPSRSNVQPYFAKWLQPQDRTSYAAYIKATNGTKQIAKVGEIALGFAGVTGTASKIREASASLSQLANQGTSSRAAIASLELGYEAGSVSADCAELYSEILEQYYANPSVKLSTLAEGYRSNGDLAAKYDAMTADQLISVAVGMVAAVAIAGTGVAAIGAAGVGLVSAAATLSFYMASDIFNRTAWLALRYSWSSRYSLRLYENLFG